MKEQRFEQVVFTAFLLAMLALIIAATIIH